MVIRLAKILSTDTTTILMYRSIQGVVKKATNRANVVDRASKGTMVFGNGVKKAIQYATLLGNFRLYCDLSLTLESFVQFISFFPQFRTKSTLCSYVQLSQHICEACGQIIPAAKDTPGPSSRN